MKQIKKIFLFPILIFIFLLILPNFAFAQVNIIDNKNQAEFAANQNLSQVIVYAPQPSDVQGIIEVCQQAQVCVIRGHTNWTNDGNTAIAGQAEIIAQKWADSLDQAAGQLGKVIYFEPWNEPMRRDVECNNLTVDRCASRLAEYIQLLRNNITSSRVRITSPAIDMHHPETPAFFNAWGSSFTNSFDVYSVHIYAPDIGCPSGGRYFKNQLSNYGVDVGSKRFIITESGALNEGNYGNPVYDDKPLCEFYCSDCNGQSLVESWINDNQILGYALFSSGPEGISWNLWAADCVKNALKNKCVCESCPELVKKGKAKLVDKFFERQGRKPSWTESLFGIGIFSGSSSVNNDNSFLQRLLTSFQEFFNISQGTYAPTHSEGEYPGDDAYRDYYRKNRIITLPGTVAEVCLEGRDIKHDLKFFPDYHDPDKVVAQLLNITGQNHRVAQSLQAYLDIHNWASGTVFSDQEEFLDTNNPQEKEKLVRRGLDLQAGQQTKAIPGEMQTDLINQKMTEVYGASVNIPQKNEQITLFDQPLFLMNKDGVIKEDDENTQKLRDGRKILKPGDGRYEVKGSIWACCNPSFFDDQPYTYEQACSDFANDWICVNGEPAPSNDLLYGSSYTKGKYIADYFTGGGDLPTYYETCYEASDQWGKDQPSHRVFNNFFIDMSPSQRYQAFPVDSKEDSYAVKKGNKYWACQITKIYLPQASSALNACEAMIKNELPGQVSENLLSNKADKKEFPCDMGNLPYTDGPTTNIDAKRSSSLFGQLFEQFLGFVTRREVDSCEVSYDTYTETEIIIDPETGEEREQTVEKQVANYCERGYEIKAKSSLIIPFYQKFEQCAKFLYAYLDGETTNKLHAEIKEKVGKQDVDPYNLFEIARGNASGVYSGGAESDNRREHYEKEPGQFKVQSYLGGDDFKLPGGGMDFAQQAAKSQFYPGELQSQLGI